MAFNETIIHELSFLSFCAICNFSLPSIFIKKEKKKKEKETIVGIKRLQAFL